MKTKLKSTKSNSLNFDYKNQFDNNNKYLHLNLLFHCKMIEYHDYHTKQNQNDTHISTTIQSNYISTNFLFFQTNKTRIIRTWWTCCTPTITMFITGWTFI